MSTKIMLGLLVVLAIGIITIPAYAASTGSPLAQYNSGVPLNMIQCDDNKLLLESPSGKPYCLSENTAAKLTDRGYSFVDYMGGDEKVPFENTLLDEENVPVTPQVTVLQVASPVEYVEDGREIKTVLQRHPGDRPMYDEIMAAELLIGNDDVGGAVSISSPPHEKYSKNEGVGLYIEDWMPTYIPDGYKLLYADTGYEDFSIRHDPPRSTEKYHSVKYQFVPNDFVLHANVTDIVLYRHTHGFSVNVQISNDPYEKIENVIERLRESRASQSGDYSEFREMTRDGKTVYAYQGGNDLNFYLAHIGYNPDEYTMIYVRSYYHTLDELIPVFESMMN